MRVLAIALLAASAALPGGAQQFENLAPYIPTPIGLVETMLEYGSVKASDVVYDLGSGDGRIVIAAAQKFGARGVGEKSLIATDILKYLPDAVSFAAALAGPGEAANS